MPLMRRVCMVLLVSGFFLWGCDLLPSPVEQGSRPEASQATTTPRATRIRQASATPQGTRPRRATATPQATRKRQTTATPRPARTATPEPAQSNVQPIAGFKTVTPDDLPPEARDTLALIDQGGPFPYRQDGVVFQNRERLLPRKASGYYHEYTVKTPGENDRGARRIITGEDGERFYTDDHYDSFVQVLPQ